MGRGASAGVTAAEIGSRIATGLQPRSAGNPATVERRTISHSFKGKSEAFARFLSAVERISAEVGALEVSFKKRFGGSYQVAIKGANDKITAFSLRWSTFSQLEEQKPEAERVPGEYASKNTCLARKPGRSSLTARVTLETLKDRS